MPKKLGTTALNYVKRGTEKEILIQYIIKHVMVAQHAKQHLPLLLSHVLE